MDDNLILAILDWSLDNSLYGQEIILIIQEDLS